MHRNPNTMAPPPVDDPDAYVRELIAQELAKQQREKSAGNFLDKAGGRPAGASTILVSNNQDTPKQNDSELQEMRAWIATLPDNGIELLRCMEFDFICSAASGADFAVNIDGSAGSNDDVSSDILLQLLQSQAPPPIPIHPRAVPYKSASCAISRGATDGRDEEERVRRERFHRPRLFQLVERSSSKTSGVMMNGGNGGGRGSRTGTRRGGRNSTQSHQQQTNAASARKYDVIARKFVTDCGDVLSLGTTERQRVADDIILAGTVVTSSLEQIGSNGIADATSQQQSVRRRCQLCLPQSFSTSKKSRKEDILEVLFVASRGRFLSVPSSNKKASNHLPFCAPWFVPTSEWFSLPTFLASRFEGALWDSYLRWKASGSVDDLSSTSNLSSAFSEKELGRALQIATYKSFAELLGREDTASGLIRDGRLWRILFSWNCLPRWTGYSAIQSVSSDIHDCCRSIVSLPLIETGSALDQYRYLILGSLKDSLAVEAEKKLLVEVSEEEKKTESNTAVRSRDRRRAKKKKKKGRKSRGLALKRIDEASPANEESSTTTDRANDTDALDEGQALLLPRRSNSPTLPPRDQNQNTIMALQILDEVISTVFQQVGLGNDDGDQSFVGVGDKEEVNVDKNNKKQEYQVRGWSRPHRISTSTAQAISSHTSPLSASSVVSSLDTPRDHPTSSVPGAGLTRRESTGESSISMLSYNSNPYHHPQSPHEHVFSFIDSSQSNYSVQPGGAYGSIFDDGSSPLGMSLNFGGFGGTFGGWSGLGNQYPSRNRSLFADLFDSEEAQEAQDVEELLMAASTAASIASSNAYDDESDVQNAYDDESEDDEGKGDSGESEVLNKIRVDDDDGYEPNHLDDDGVVSVASQVTEPGANHAKDPDVPSVDQKSSNDRSTASPAVPPSPPHLPPPTITPPPIIDVPQSFQSPPQNDAGSANQSPAPSEPPTPPPQLSPIQVSLADLGKFVKAKRSKDLSREFEKAMSASVSSLPGSPPRLDSSKRNWSRDDLTRLTLSKDDASMRPRRRIRSGSSHNFDEVMSYRNAVSKSIKAASTCSHEIRSAADSAESRLTDFHRTTEADLLRPRHSIPDLNQVRETSPIDGTHHMNICARSETAVDAYEESSHVNVIRAPPHDEVDNATATRDGTTTISSAGSPAEAEEVANLREERNAFRDLCLTLGAEVAKLKSTLAALQQGQNTSTAYAHPQMEYGAASARQQQYFYPVPAQEFNASPYFPPGYAVSDAGIPAMSDAGIQDTTRSEDGTDNPHPGGDNAGLQQWAGGQGHPARIIQIRRPSLGCNRTVSNASVDNDAGCHGSITMSVLRSSVHRDTVGGVPSNGLQSRLSIDINNYCMSISSQLKKQEGRRLLATKRLTRLVTALWPRAQVK